MVLQRWQSLLLFIALVLVATFSVSNYATIDSNVLNASGNLGYWFYNMAIVLLLLVSIFLFRHLSLQKILVVVSALMMCGSAVWGFCFLRSLSGEGSVMQFGISWILLAVAFVLALVSWCLINKDYKLLRSAYKLR